MPRHIYFVAPEKPSPTGGINVMYQFAEILRDHGHPVSVHFHSPDFVYEFFDSDVETTYSPLNHDRHPEGLRGVRSRFREWKANRRKPRRSNANRLSVPGRAGRGDDTQSSGTDLRSRRFPDAFHVVFLKRRSSNRIAAFTLAAYGANSQNSRHGDRDPCYFEAMRLGRIASVLRRSSGHHVPLFLDRANYRFHRDRRARTIAYMPRKRGAEAESLVAVLQNANEPACKGSNSCVSNGFRLPGSGGACGLA